MYHPEDSLEFFPPNIVRRARAWPPTQWPHAEMMFLDTDTRRAWCAWMDFRGITPGCEESKIHWKDMTNPEDLAYLFGDY